MIESGALQHKRFLIIFLMTVLVPCDVLEIFGILALSNKENNLTLKKK
jgi:hypothetical protein